jgi:hypothetical protein
MSLRTIPRERERSQATSDVTRARIIFVPGLNPKPPPEIYRREILRVIDSSLRRTRPRSAAWLAAHDEAFVLVAWTYLFYGAYRDITVDLPGIERLLVQREPSEADLRELRSWRRRALRGLHVVGDALPLLGRTFAPANTRRLLHEASRYLKDRDGVGAAVRGVLRATLESAWSDGAAVLLIGHSLGSVIAYDTLWELTHVQRSPGEVALLVTLGSPLATRFVQRSVQGAGATGAGRYPHNVRRWVNLTARGDTTALKARLKPLYREMLDLELIDSIEDFVDFDNFFRGALGLNAHDAYGYIAQPAVAELVGDWLERSL